MDKINLSKMLKDFAEKTRDINEDLEQLEKTDISTLSEKEKENIQQYMEKIEALTSKAETILKKTEREGLPTLLNKQDNKIKNENKVENKTQAPKPNSPAPKPKKSNLMKPKPTLSNGYGQQNNRKKSEE